MKQFILFIFSITFSILLSAQVTDVEKTLRQQATDTTIGWKTGGVLSLTFSQSSYSNWAAGGQNSLSGNMLVSLLANYKNPKNAWDNNLDIGYGGLVQGFNISKSPFIKTDDKLELNSKYGRLAFNNWYYAALLNFKTQMTAGYNYPDDSTKISDLLAPAYLLGALGMDYKQKDYLTLFIAPITGKTTIVNNQDLADAGAFGVDAAEYNDLGNKIKDGKNIRIELGGYLRAMYTKEIVKNISLNTKIDLFSNYLNNPGNIDVNWEVLVSMKINKYITATINTHLIYDHDINILVDKDEDGIMESQGPRTQFKEVFGLGFSYKF